MCILSRFMTEEEKGDLKSMYCTFFRLSDQKCIFSNKLSPIVDTFFCIKLFIYLSLGRRERKMLIKLTTSEAFVIPMF